MINRDQWAVIDVDLDPSGAQSLRQQVQQALRDHLDLP